MNAKEMLGCCLIFAAIILAQLSVQRKAKLADEVMGRTGVSKKSKKKRKPKLPAPKRANSSRRISVLW